MKIDDSLTASAAAESASCASVQETLVSGGLYAECTTPPSLMNGIAIGRLAGFADNGDTPLVTLPTPDDLVARRARTAIDLHGAHIGRELVLAFEGGDPSRPVVMSLLHEAQPLSRIAGAPTLDTWQLQVDGERCILSARHELVLECGRARLVLRADGRAELRGVTVVTEATGANKVRGGSVQLN
ncbi:DUF6484 domain-containing protein [Roseateles sp. MS654]|uniref:DUF6484 domain-containing protein n=1 Tax=Roseateles sp. MS654 TaxID=3412685 RepID=UPI003C2B65A2